MAESFAWLVTAIALYGTYLNACGERKGFYYWLVSNACFCAINLGHAQYAQGFLFAAYFVLAIKGLESWEK